MMKNKTVASKTEPTAKDFKKQVLSKSSSSLPAPVASKKKPSAKDFKKEVLSKTPSSKVPVASKQEPDEPKKVSKEKPGRPLEMQGVKSSNVDAIGYRARKRALYVRFKDGSTYVYHGVPKDEFLALANAGSKGKYLHYSIKDSYDYDRIS